MHFDPLWQIRNRPSLPKTNRNGWFHLGWFHDVFLCKNHPSRRIPEKQLLTNQSFRCQVAVYRWKTPTASVSCFPRVLTAKSFSERQQTAVHLSSSIQLTKWSTWDDTYEQHKQRWEKAELLTIRNTKNTLQQKHNISKKSDQPCQQLMITQRHQERVPNEPWSHSYTWCKCKHITPIM